MLIPVYCLLLTLNCYLTAATNSPDVELRIANMEIGLLERISNLENIVNNQKNEISMLTHEVANLSSRGQQNERETITLKNLILRKKILQNEATLHTDRNAYHAVEERRRLVGNIDNGQRIAFYAFMRNSEPIQKHKTIIFDETKTNFGHGYNNNTGIFTAPVSGVYVLTFTAHPGPNSYSSLEIVVNNEVEGTTFVDSSPSEHDLTGSTAVIVVWMNQGDVTFVRVNPSFDSVGTVYSSFVARCSFSGWKISD